MPRYAPAYRGCLKPKAMHEKQRIEKQFRETNSAVMAMVSTPHITDDDLEHLYYTTAMDYAVMRYGYQLASTWWKKPAFWAVWKIVWMFNNKDLLADVNIRKKRPPLITWDQYAEYQLHKSLKYNIGEKAQLELQLT